MLSCIISLIHLLVIIWALSAPFVKCLRPSYVLLMPFIMIHWILLDDTCILTIIENNLRGCAKEETFMHRLVGGIYNLPEGILGQLIWIYVIVTWVYAVSKTSWGDIKKSLLH
ncbi:hypothetical protein PBCVAN69C_675L [Paramecium bursaria Chlorella virus AN69C]|uniref:Uncharacterized protein n=1 Tax=Paramecium bursaria Chlorella virus IL3A TaxID=46019 RepID=M1HW41_PBCVI|nr:hypothetical protein PBCVAN69C_675L [Paramecium bursaria Chlorella virus AN69C]AGE53941.1 hypothetical protein PBCVIL3A_497R [Paramecium bursaria Chlorella virus IL3A]AGE55350.1 hypothetical protein PBCVMA1E_524R [Paramecium bursaria Chlorella virus MA1E]AGE57370.1 hypothetical protein PBCVNEJV4_503R [Paramecium bursaria Chlorella virus NE-JV-4]